MLQLPNGCSCSNPSIYPPDWNKPGASIKKDWYLQYYFIDPTDPEKEKYPNGRLKIHKQGINRLKTIAERREAVKILEKELLHILKVEGYNPRTKTFVAPIMEYEIHPSFRFIDALKKAFDKIVVAKSTRDDMTSMLNYFEAAADQLRVSVIPISDIRRRHIKAVLDQVGKNRKFSAHRFNKYRSYLMILFAELVELEVVESNFIREIKIQKTITKIRDVLTIEQRQKIDETLKVNHYSFWRFLQIFFHSGGRVKELLALKFNDVDLVQQRYKTIIYKGKNQREIWRPIKDNILFLWQELLFTANNGDYIFSDGLQPGAKEKPIRREQITRRWKDHIKTPLEITADFYSLKHLNLDETAAALDIDDAAAMAGHTTPIVTMKHYATGEKQRQNDRLKKVANTFA